MAIIHVAISCRCHQDLVVPDGLSEDEIARHVAAQVAEITDPSGWTPHGVCDRPEILLVDLEREVIDDDVANDLISSLRNATHPPGDSTTSPT